MTDEEREATATIIEGAARAAGLSVTEWTAEACEEKLVRLGAEAFNRDEIGRAYSMGLAVAFQGGAQEAMAEGFGYASTRLMEMLAMRGGPREMVRPRGVEVVEGTAAPAANSGAARILWRSFDDAVAVTFEGRRVRVRGVERIGGRHRFHFRGGEAGSEVSADLREGGAVSEGAEVAEDSGTR